jgi:hypothetical protein
MSFQKILSYIHKAARLLPLGLVLLVFCSREKPDSGADMETGTPVQVVHPSRMDVTEFIDLNANTVFLKKEMVRAPFPGFIAAIEKTIGDQVRTGDLLLRLKTREAAAGDSLALTAGTTLLQEAVSIYARSNGILTTRNFNAGDYVSEGEEIAVISNPSSLRITLNVPYQYAAVIDRSAPCEIVLPDGKKVPAAILKIIPSVDPVAQTQTFLLELRGAAFLPENLNVNARLPLKTARGAVVVPRSAIMSDETMSSFWIMKMIDESTAIRVDINKGIEADSLVQVLEPGLQMSDAIICEGAYGLPDTARVAIAGKNHE